MSTSKKGSALVIIFFIMIGITIIATSLNRALSWYADSMREHREYWKKQYQCELLIAYILAYYYEDHKEGTAVIPLDNHRYQLSWTPRQAGNDIRLELSIRAENRGWARGYILLSKKDDHFHLLERTIMYESSDQK
jgi:hypothetical protein